MMQAISDPSLKFPEVTQASEATVLWPMRVFLAGCAWLQQRIKVTSDGHIERHRRKQLARDHHAPLPGDVNIIELRRRESTPH